MRINAVTRDVIYLILLILIVIGLPFGIRAYDRRLEPVQSVAGAKEFTLTGHASKGWVLGEVRANDIITLWRDDGSRVKPQQGSAGFAQAPVAALHSLKERARSNR